jgi:hypothetical protein
MEKNIPDFIQVGGVKIDVVNVMRCVDNNLGNCCVAESKIEIADIWDKDRQQSDESKRNTFYHELVHCILDTMAESDLSKNEKFVCVFSSLLNEAMANAVFKV